MLHFFSAKKLVIIIFLLFIFFQNCIAENPIEKENFYEKYIADSSSINLVHYIFPYKKISDSQPFVSGEIIEDRMMPAVATIHFLQHPKNRLMIFIIMLNIAFFFAIVKILNERKLIFFFKSLFFNSFSIKSFIEQKNIFNSVSFPLFIIYTLMLSMGLQSFSSFGNLFYIENNIFLLIIIVLIVFFIMIMKFGLHSIFGYIFDIKGFSKIISNYTIGYNFIGSVVLLPFFILNYLNPSLISLKELHTILFVIALIAVAARSISEWIACNQIFPYSKIFLVLYLCSTEIVPWFFILKISTS